MSELSPEEEAKWFDSKFSSSYRILVGALGYSSTGEIAKECGRGFDEFADAVARLAERAAEPDPSLSDSDVPDLSPPSEIR